MYMKIQAVDRCGCKKRPWYKKIQVETMTTVTIDILNEQALNLLRDLELLKLIRLRKEREKSNINGASGSRRSEMQLSERY